MCTPKHPLFAALAASVLLLAPASSMGDSMLVQQGKAGAALDFRVIIPPVMQVLENHHPTSLEAEADGDWSAQQRLVVVSNMKRGFCVTLRMSHPNVDAWRLQTAPDQGVTLSTVGGGYRLCTSRAGRYTLLLEHEFDAAQATPTGALRWPVQTDISAI